MFATTVTDKPEYIRRTHQLVAKFGSLGGEVLFGTDVGYMEDYRTWGEVEAMVDCGMIPREILRSPTTAPALRFHAQNEKGTVEPGRLADLTVLDDDPGVHLKAFAHVRMTIRSGRVLYSRQLMAIPRSPPINRRVAQINAAPLI